MAEAETNICSTCGKSYKHMRNLTTHEKSHSGALPFTCCGLTFPSRRGLQRHSCAVHGETKTYVCTTCSKAFATRDDLIQHESRELSCDVCGEKFLRKAEMRTHLACHTDEKCYSCECGARYKYASSLSRHMKTKHTNS